MSKNLRWRFRWLLSTQASETWLRLIWNVSHFLTWQHAPAIVELNHKHAAENQELEDLYELEKFEILKQLSEKIASARKTLKSGHKPVRKTMADKRYFMKDLHDLQLAGVQLSELCSNDSRQLTFHLHLMMFGLRLRELKAFDALWLKKEVALETEKKEEAKMLAYVGLRVLKTSPQVTLARRSSMSSTS